MPDKTMPLSDKYIHLQYVHENILSRTRSARPSPISLEQGAAWWLGGEGGRLKPVGRMVEEGGAWYLVQMFCKVVKIVCNHDDDEDEEDADDDVDDGDDYDDWAPVGMRV